MSYPVTTRTTATRRRDRVGYDHSTVHAVLDEALHCHLGFIVDGAPRVLPTLHVRIGDTLYVHGSTGSRPLREAQSPDGLAVCVTVTLLDGLILARSQFNHSANYRSVMAHGVARLVEDAQTKRAVLAALVDKIAVGRAADTRPPDDRELAQTAVLALPLEEVSVKTRSGGTREYEQDADLPNWSGVVALHTTRGFPWPEPGTRSPVPDYLRPDRSAWLDPAPMRGDHVILEALDLSQVDELFAATDDAEVHRWMTTARPADPAGTAETVATALRDHERGWRVPWVIRDARTGAVAGTTSYYAVDGTNRSLAIGYTMLGRPWWRTGINTEAKLLLLSRAFDDLGAVRVELHTHSGNERSQRAIERLGARREAVLRKHKLLWDGTWRDTVQYAIVADDWPAIRDALSARLRPPQPEPSRNVSSRTP